MNTTTIKLKAKNTTGTLRTQVGTETALTQIGVFFLSSFINHSEKIDLIT